MTDEERQPGSSQDGVEVQESGEASADGGSVAVSGVVLGDINVNHHPPAGQVPVWPMVVGRPPPLASGFQPREVVRERVLAARRQGEDVVLTQDADRQNTAGTRVLAGGGGVGKSQLAAWFAEQAVRSGTDLVVWVNAATPEQVITTYATAAARTGVPGAIGADPDAAAAAFIEWLHTTDRHLAGRARRRD